MKIQGLLAAIAMTASATAAAQSTATSGAVFAPTDGNVNFFDICYGCDKSGMELGIFDDEVTDFDGASWLSVDLNGDVIPFSPEIGQTTDYTITNNAGDSFTLTGNDHFQVALRRGAEGDATFMPWSSPDSVVCNDTTDSCTTSWNNAMTSLMVDVRAERIPDGGEQVIPVPAAFWLLGSGLVGLVGVARRKSA